MRPVGGEAVTTSALLQCLTFLFNTMTVVALIAFFRNRRRLNASRRRVLEEFSKLSDDSKLQYLEDCRRLGTDPW